MRLRFTTVLGVCLAVAPAARAQFAFHIDGRELNVHSFMTQGFLYSNQNNYLTMPTSNGSFAMTDFGVNISTRISENFRIGAQIYDRNVGQMGNWHPTLDWAMGDYRFKSWFGMRAGRVKTTLGLFNDVQDMDSLHVFALLPESMYPVDWRNATIAHDGGDFYGDIALRKLGTLSYTGWAGVRPNDSTMGYFIAAKTSGINIDQLSGRQNGGDLRWTTPIGVLAGVDYMTEDISGTGTYKGAPYSQGTKADELMQYFFQYTLKNFQFDAEYRKNIRDVDLNLNGTIRASIVDQRDWYVAATYRISKRFEVGAYRSEYYADTRKDTHPPTAHLFDTVVSGRINLNKFWYAKIEGHLFNGAPTTASATRGFYTASNPDGILPTTNLLVIRTGVFF
jgi:hypothetical protein